MPVVAYLDSFSHYQTDAIPLKHGPAHLSDTVTNRQIIVGGGRNGNGCFRINGGDFIQYSKITISPGLATACVECAVKIAPGAISSFFSNYTVLQLAAGGAVQVGIIVQPSGAAEVIGPNGSPGLVTAAGAIPTGVWVHLGLKAVIHNLHGFWEFRINGVPRLTANEVDTSNGNANVDQIVMGGVHPQQTEFSDMVISDGFCGDCNVLLFPVTGNGAHVAWTPTAGTATQCVDDPYMSPLTGDTDYISSATAGARASFTHGAYTLPPGKRIRAVQQVASVRNDDATPRQVKQSIRSGATDYDAATASAPGSSWSMMRRVVTDDPTGGYGWTAPGFNAAQASILLVS